MNNLAQCRYFKTKKAAVTHLNATGWQKEDHIPGEWFKYRTSDDNYRSASVSRFPKIKGLWVIRYFE